MAEPRLVGGKVLLCALGTLAAPVALACQSISSPYTLRDGVYCLASDVEVASSAFDLGDDTTLDCMGHRISDLTRSRQTAVFARGDNIVLKNCVFEGFGYPVVLNGVTNYRIVGNTFLNPLNSAIDSMGENDEGLIARNTFRYAARPPEGYPASWYDGSTYAVLAGGLVDIVDNTVTSMQAEVTGVVWNSQYGILSYGNDGGVIASNLMRGLNLVLGGRVGIVADGAPVVYRNVVVAAPAHAYTWDQGVVCQGGNPLAKGNIVLGFAVSYVSCANRGLEGLTARAYGH